MSARTLLSLILGVALGVGIGIVVAPDPVDQGPLAVPRATESADVNRVEVPVGAPTSEARPLIAETRNRDDDTGGPTARAPGEEDLISAHLMAWARQTYLETAQQEFSTQPSEATTTAAMELFRQGVLWLPAQLARSYGPTRDREVEQAVSAADGASLLALAAAGLYTPDPGILTGPLLDASVARRAGGSNVDGPYFSDDDGFVTKGLTIVFGSGRHSLDEKRLRGTDRRSLPSDVSIVGAGMDATLLTLNNISVAGNVERFSLRDLTIDCENDGLFDLRRGNATLDLLRVRILRFDAGHGGADIFTGDGVMLRATACEFLGGFGRSPGGGNLFSVHSTHRIYARFENCAFDLLRLGHSASLLNSKNDLRFVGCRFDRLSQSHYDQLPAAWFSSCNFGEMLPSFSDPGLARDLAELFPGW